MVTAQTIIKQPIAMLAGLRTPSSKYCCNESEIRQREKDKNRNCYDAEAAACHRLFLKGQAEQYISD